MCDSCALAHFARAMLQTLTKVMLYAHAMRMRVLHAMVPYDVICSCCAHECGAYSGAA